MEFFLQKRQSLLRWPMLEKVASNKCPQMPWLSTKLLQKACWTSGTAWKGGTQCRMSVSFLCRVTAATLGTAV